MPRTELKPSHKKEYRNKRLNKKQSKDSDSDSSASDTEANSDLDSQACRKLIQKIYPSKYLQQKIDASNKLKKYIKKATSKSSRESEEEEPSPASHRKSSPSKKSSEEEDIWETESDDDDDDEDSSYEPTETQSSDEEEEEDMPFIKKRPASSKKYYILQSSFKDMYETDDDEVSETDEYEYDNDEEEDEDEDVEVSSDEEDSEEPAKKSHKPSNKSKEEHVTIPSTMNAEALTQLKELLAKNPKDKSMQKCIDIYERDLKIAEQKLERQMKKQKAKHMRIFSKIIHDKNTMNDFTFYEKLNVETQRKLIKEVREINKIIRIEKPYRMSLLECDIPIAFKACAMKKINLLKYMDPSNGEFYKIKSWVDAFMKIPFSKYNELPISIESGVDMCHEFMETAQKTLDEAVYGLNDAKMQIMQMLGQFLTNPKSIGSAIAIHGPPGTGKTSLVKEGISKILNRPFAFIALGGATDSSFLEGHEYTYEGSTWGKIVQILIASQCMNPVIYFDELDKISDTPRGEEIASILTHLTDTSQNSQFHDKYFSEINFDLSKCLFIFSYNDESKINPILKDRMYRIKTNGYSGKEKTNIAHNYLLPKIREQLKFNSTDITMSDDVVAYINETHCCKEDGVRNMKRCLEIIHTKLNLYRLMKPGSNIFASEMSLAVEFPFQVTKDVVDKLIKIETKGMETWRSMYM